MSEKRFERICEVCGEIFTSRRGNAKYCENCRDKMYQSRNQTEEGIRRRAEERAKHNDSIKGEVELMERQICGECRYHTYEEIDRGYVCTNADSLYCTEWTDYNDTCDCFEERGIE